MRTFSIYTLGCKVNQYEGAQIRQFLEGLGLSAVKPADKPDLFIINTCCVTATASAKSRQYIQRAKKLNKRAINVICGCLPAIKSELRSIENKSTCLVASREGLASKLGQIVGGARDGCSLTNSSKISSIAQHSGIKPDNNQKINIFAGLTSLPKLPLLTSFKGHTRAFLKVQDGCDGLCSYCIIPKIRSEVQSKPIEEAVSEAKALVSAGHKEIVVTGVCLGAYGRQTVRRAGEQGSRRRKTEDGGPCFAEATQGRQKTERRTSNIERPTSSKDTLSVLLERLAGVADKETTRKEQRTSNIELRTSNVEPLAGLLEELAGVEGPFDSFDNAQDRSAQGKLPRIRVSSLEPGDISEELLDVFCGHPNIMPHIHLSVQSGSDNILKRMCRQYGVDELRGKIALIKSRLDRPAITCDIIVGFPGETEGDFQATVELAKWAGFSKMHIFPFSARAGTAAAKMKDRVQPKDVKERAEVLRNLGDCLGRKFREQFVGETCEVLLEDTEPPSGRCERYFMVVLTTKTRRHENQTTDYTDSTDSLATKKHKKTQNKTLDNLVPLCLGGKGDIMKVKITAVSSERAIGEVNGKH